MVFVFLAFDEWCHLISCSEDAAPRFACDVYLDNVHSTYVGMVAAQLATRYELSGRPWLGTDICHVAIYAHMFPGCAKDIRKGKIQAQEIF
jgi:hypothetical protein